MKNLSRSILLVASTVAFTPTVSAELIDRGNGMIYDTNQNLTWLQDADVRGKTSWYSSNEWAQNLEHGGFDDWRLPETTRYDDPTCVDRRIENGLFFDTLFECTGGEMERLTAEADPFQNPIFKNVRDSRYWTGTPYRDGIDPCAEQGVCYALQDNGVRKNFFWQWSFNSKREAIPYKTTLDGLARRFALPVRNGDVVPEDSSGVLMENLSIYSPSLNFHTQGNTTNIWANFVQYGTGPNNEMLWKLDKAGANTTPFTGAMTGEVSEDLNITIRSIIFQDTSYWVNMKYFGEDRDNQLWQLVDFGINQ
ncbi:MAG: hypothetical protein methR_P1879 [Methyloprofundus sp.]|nr:MAG: hypothetical protein methR_P1879 [Methyloprofundus sp.]